MWTLIDDSVGILAGTMLKINPLDLEIMVRLKEKNKKTQLYISELMPEIKEKYPPIITTIF